MLAALFAWRVITGARLRTAAQWAHYGRVAAVTITPELRLEKIESGAALSVITFLFISVMAPLATMAFNCAMRSVIVIFELLDLVGFVF